ncbi:MAG: histidine kinase, partial [Terracidiphilus sp.]
TPFTNRNLVVASIALGAIALLAAVTVMAFRSIAHRGPFRVQKISLAKQDDWQAFGGTWQYADGVMQNNSDERGAKLMSGPTYWANYSIEADVLLLGQYGDAGLILRATDEEEGVDAYHGYMAGLRDLDNRLFLGRADYGWREFAMKPVAPRVYAQQWYHVKFLAYGCDFAISATAPNGQTTAEAVEDPGCLTEGRFGLKSYNTGAEWRNVEIRPATQQDLVAMTGGAQPSIATPTVLPTGAVPEDYDQYVDPIQRDLLAHRTDVNAQTISSLRLLSPDVPASVTVHGVVTLTSPVLFIQDPSGGLAIPGSHTHVPLQIGDEVEAKGDAELHDFSSRLRNAEVRLLWSHTPVPPVAVTAAQAATGAFDAEYVEIEGRLEHKDQAPGNTLVLTLDEGSQSFLAIVSESGQSGRLRALKDKSRLRLRGICVVDSSYTHDLTSFALLLPSFNDVEVMEGPPWWSAGHIVATIIGVLLLALAGLSCYILIERWRMQAVLEERERLAHEMHDTLAQSFAGLGFQLEAIRNEANDGTNIVPQLDVARDMVRNSHEEARRSIAMLRPENLESIGLLRAMENCAHRMVNGTSSIAVCVSSEGSERAIPLRISDTLMRIGLEAIANAIRHAHPAHLNISLTYLKSAVEMAVEDDGCGFSITSELAGFGISGMHKRADSIGATLAIRSAPGEGTTLCVHAPMPPSFLRSFVQRMHIPWRKASHGNANR